MGASASLHHRPLRTTLVLLLAALAISIHQLAQPPTTLHLPKIFVIGLSKTGTTSIGDALERLGYRRLGWRDIRSRHLVHTWAHDADALSALIAQTQQYDAFEDLPWPKVYREIADLYPTAKFILSLRRDDETWLRSMQTHMGRGEWGPYEMFYGATTFAGNEEVIRQAYVNHTRGVREFFGAEAARRERFVEMRIDDEGELNWGALCRVAECPGGRAPRMNFPRANAKASWDRGALANALAWCKGWTITRAEEQTVKYYYERDVKSVKRVLNALWSMYDFIERAYTELEFRIVALFLPPLSAEQTEQVAHL